MRVIPVQGPLTTGQVQRRWTLRCAASFFRLSLMRDSSMADRTARSSPGRLTGALKASRAKHHLEFPEPSPSEEAMNYPARVGALNTNLQAHGPAFRRLVAGWLALSRRPHMDVHPHPRDEFEASRARLRVAVLQYLDRN